MEFTAFILMRSGALHFPGEAVYVCKWQEQQLLGSEDVVQVAQGLPNMHGAPYLILGPAQTSCDGTHLWFNHLGG